MSQTSATTDAAKEVVGSKFTMRGLPLLSSGITTEPVAGCDGLWIHSKVYSRGGENALHAHANETHAFFVLQGQATFRFGDGSSTDVAQYEGVMLPRGAMYCFEATGDEVLVMMRIGAAEQRPPQFTETFHLRDFGEGSDFMVDASGKPMVAQNKGRSPLEPVVVIPNAFFPKDHG